MSDKTTLHKILVILSTVILYTLGLAGCQSGIDPLIPVVETQAIQSQQPLPGDLPSIQASPTNVATESKPDPAAIQAAWQSSPHADTYVLDVNGQNNTCARCHAPINWMPTMGDLPETCFACKFELEQPPPTISKNDWTDIPCNICHKVDKKNNVQPEFAWLEIAPLGEYAEVGSATELCLKCHSPTDIPGHGIVQLAGAHPDYECTKCHSAHDTKASCDTLGCHVEPTTPIVGHDSDHQLVSCVACHDGSGMEVGPVEETGIWTTFMTGTANAGSDKFAFTSHNVVREAKCDRCHFLDNPWNLSDAVIQP